MILILIGIVIFCFLLISGIALYFFFRKKKDICDEVKCLNDGICVDGNCKCNYGFGGKRCEITKIDIPSPSPSPSPDPDLCIDVQCGSFGTCNSATGKCDCKSGYTGDKCQTPPDLCIDVQCGSFGTCNSATGKCDCKSGYTGDKCETPPDLCLGIQCGSFGTCNSTTGKCDCKSGYTGDKCETPPILNQPWQCVDNTNVPVRSQDGKIQCISTLNKNSPDECWSYAGRTICESEVSKLSKTATPGYTCTSQNYNDKNHWCHWAKDSFDKMTTVNHPWQCVDNTNVPVRSQDGKIQCISTLNTNSPDECLQYASNDLCVAGVASLLRQDKGVVGGYTCDSKNYDDKTHWCYFAKDSFDKINLSKL